jgi:glycosyltransferase involved in cell wall biosynthesis
MKNILILGIYPPPYGGISTVITNMIPTLKKNQYNIHLFSPGCEGESFAKKKLTVHKPSEKQLLSFQFLFSGSFIKFCLTLLKNGIPFFALRRMLKISSWIYFLQKHILSRVEIDLICAFHLFDKGLSATILGKQNHIPIVIVNLGEIYVEKLFYKENISAVKYITNNADEFISVSKHCSDSYITLGLTPDVNIIYSGVDQNLYNLDVNSSKIKKKYGIDEHDFVVLFLGRMIYDMGLDYLLDTIPHIIRENTSIVFLICGARGELSDDVIQMSEKFVGRIHHEFNISFNELPAYYSSADLVVVPTRDDRACMGLAIKEAMFSGKPVIGNNVGGIPEAIVHDKTGLIIDTADSELFASAILGLEGDRSRLERYGERAYLRANALFGVEPSNAKYVEIFNNLTQGNM